MTDAIDWMTPPPQKPAFRLWAGVLTILALPTVIAVGGVWWLQAGAWEAPAPPVMARVATPQPPAPVADVRVPLPEPAPVVLPVIVADVRVPLPDPAPVVLPEPAAPPELGDPPELGAPPDPTLESTMTMIGKALEEMQAVRPEPDVGPVLARAKALLQAGDIISAREILRAAAMTSAAAAALMADSYDPQKLAGGRYTAHLADPAQAAAWAARARELSQKEAHG